VRIFLNGYVVSLLDKQCDSMMPHLIGMMLGGQAGVKLAMGSRDAHQPRHDIAAHSSKSVTCCYDSRVLGVDDWAWRGIAMARSW